MSYGPHLEDLFRRGAIYVDKILGLPGIVWVKTWGWECGNPLWERLAARLDWVGNVA